MNAREMMEEMQHEIASLITDDEELQLRIIKGVNPRTQAQRARAVRVLSRGVDWLRGETGRTGGF